VLFQFLLNPPQTLTLTRTLNLLKYTVFGGIELRDFGFEMGFGEFLVMGVLVFGVLSLMEFLDIGSERVVQGFLFVFGRFKGKLLKARYC
jgi:hypothetical protein